MDVKYLIFRANLISQMTNFSKFCVDFTLRVVNLETFYADYILQMQSIKKRLRHLTKEKSLHVVMLCFTV